MAANPSEDASVSRYGVTPEYLRVMRIPLPEGPAAPRERSGRHQLPSLLVSETAARELFPGRDSIGERVSPDRKHREGALADHRRDRWRRPARQRRPRRESPDVRPADPAHRFSNTYLFLFFTWLGWSC